LAILQAERAKTTNPDDLAAIDREIAGVKSKMSRRDLIAAGVEGAPAAPLSKTTVPAPQTSRRDTITAAVGGMQSGPSLGDAQAATNAQNELSDAWKKQLDSHQTAQTNIALLNQIKGLSGEAVTGAGDARRLYLMKLGALVGIPGMDQSATASDLLNKYGSQLVQGLAARGISTDAGRELVGLGSPNSHMQPAAINEAADSMIAREQMVQARTKAMQPYANKRDAVGMQSAQADFDAKVDPRMFQMRTMTPQQVQGYVSRLSPSDAQTLLQKYKAAKAAGYLQ
jgi:hypothetical protein